MRAVPVVLALSLFPSFVGAENNDSEPAPTNLEPRSTEVIGGTAAPLGKWPDTAAVFFGSQQGCTGTLIAPTVALTAGHCNDSSLTKILVGTNSLNRVADGETLQVMKRVELRENDTTVLVLATPSKFAPRALGTGWAKFDIKNGARVQV
ncbi:MAG: trypsin-like serine protease, partial [Deltaproteobacteria bacterium]|nr:trypsin-like serine protease [Deltaproteobacteria bacterium]